ncbi:protein-L-isoaspartate(D-aspartate) O-methyltransferase [Nonomuraea maritima]|uniref:Protein-L-isoaspartate O-methyltransferase n=1 Tax=Nonomuraea maritima TaxID=683260 RepID=A0A1G8SR55_9ACTN|nr:methyltransferase domain-containing protein [Nonomuraea maritima]SDJ31726.1 protein-L-isoaspartate(D-aspartate) O-methyltransferase [Nonomuraea maritima]
MNRQDGETQRRPAMLPHIAWRLEAMIAAIAERRAPATGAIAQALRKVPRHWFVPSVGLALDDDGGAVPIDRDTDPPAWWDAVYSGRPIAARVGGSSYTCVNPAPSAVVDLLELLDPRPGQQVLEVGTGSGWITALLCRLVGASGNVTSVEPDPEVAETAARNLAAAGIRPHLLVGDGRDRPAKGPYDRVLVLSAVPGEWVEQARPGAVVVEGDDTATRFVVAEPGT